MLASRPILAASAVAWATLTCAGGRASSWTGRAVIVGVADYPGTQIDVLYADDDAIELRRALLRDGEHWQSDNITVLVNSEATKDAVLDALYAMNDASDPALNPEAGPDDVCLFAFAGHGGLAMYDFNSAGLIGSWTLRSWVLDCPSEHVCIVLDTCSALSFVPLSAGPGYVALASSDVDEPSYESLWVEQSFFLFYVVEALGEAVTDTDGDGFASAEEVFAYAASAATEWHEDQHPLLVDDHAGPLRLVARGPGTRKGPVTPPDLPLGGGIVFGGLSCSPRTGGGRPPLWGLLAGGLLALLFTGRRRRASLLGLLAALWWAAGCGAFPAGRLGARGGFRPEGRPACLLAATEGALETNESGSARAPGAELRPAARGRVTAYRLGIAVPLSEAESDYYPGPAAGVYKTTRDGRAGVELGLDLSLLVGREVDITAALASARLDVACGQPRRPGRPRLRFYAGPRLLGSMSGTNWARNLVFEFDVGYGAAAGVTLPDGEAELGLAWDRSITAANIRDIITFTWAAGF